MAEGGEWVIAKHKRKENAVKYNASKNGPLVDDRLTDSEKCFVHRVFKKLIWEFRKSCHLNEWEADDVTSDLYNSLMSKEFYRAFPKGKPKSEAQFVAYIRQGLQYAKIHAVEKAMRLPELTLDRPIYDDEGEEYSSFVETIADDSRADPAEQIELRHVPEVVRLICQKHRFSSRNSRIAELSLLWDFSPMEIAESQHVKSNAVSQAKFRTGKALEEDGELLLGAAIGNAA